MGGRWIVVVLLLSPTSTPQARAAQKVNAKHVGDSASSVTYPIIEVYVYINFEHCQLDFLGLRKYYNERTCLGSTSCLPISAPGQISHMLLRMEGTELNVST